MALLPHDDFVKLRRLNKEIDARTWELNEDQHRLLELRRSIEAVELKRDIVTKQLDNLIRDQAISACRKIADGLFTSLPRELRDAVYRHICVSEFIVVMEPKSEDLPDPGRYGAPRPDYHAFDPSFVGVDVAIEIAEMYFTQNRFAVTTDPRTYDHALSDFLQNPSPPIPGIDRTLLLRNLVIGLDCSNLDLHSHPGFVCNCPSHKGDQETPILYNISSTLSELSALPYNDKLVIEIILKTAYDMRPISAIAYPAHLTLDDERRFINQLEAIAGHYYKLRQAGAKVTIMHLNICKSADTHLVWDLSERFEEMMSKQKEYFTASPLEPLERFRAPRALVVTEDGGYVRDDDAERDWRKRLRERWGVEYSFEWHRPER